MPKYDETVKKQCVEAIKGIVSGKHVLFEGKPIKTLKDIQRVYGPNPLATKRYCKKAGIDSSKIPKNLVKVQKEHTQK